MAKRRVKVNRQGNWCGFIGTSRVEEFGDQSWSEAAAKKWAETEFSRQDAQDEVLANLPFVVRVRK